MKDLFAKDGGGDGSLKNEKTPLLRPESLTKQKWYRPRNVMLLLLLAVFLVFALSFIVQKFYFHRTIDKKSPAARLSSVATVNDDYFKKCAPTVWCDAGSKYRTINGSCNNLARPVWGAAMTPFYRYMDPEFSDGISKFRKQSDGRPLPNARNLTLTIFHSRGNSVHDGVHNELLVPWGQFVTHDMAYSPVNSINSSFPAALEHCKDKNPPVECEAVIQLYPDDPIYGKYNLSILKFMRAVTSMNYSCPLTPSTVLNHNTHYIDASNVYGSDTKLANELRMMSGGKLAYNRIGTEVYCPQDPSKIVKKGNQTQVTIAFLAGDVNVNQNLGIALFQNMFLRFHNYIADELQAKHPYWTDETVYQESRRIIGAVVQAITYNRFLPIILGERYAENYGLTRKASYDATITASVAQEMTSGAFRLLHNIIPSTFNLVSDNYTVYDVLEPSKLILRPDDVIGNFDGMLRGFMETPGREPQSSYNDLISNIVVNPPIANSTASGFDLLSYDIQRGRDVGLPPYTKVREFCGLSSVNSFDDLSDHVPSATIDRLKSLYSSVHDIDFYVGILLERKINGAMVGPTARCVIADGFYRLRVADRFFYDVQGQPGSFTPEQIKSLEKITLSHIVCASSHLEHVQKDTFDVIDHIRLMRLKPRCETYKIDLTAW